MFVSRDVGTRAGTGGSMPLQFLVNQLTLNQPGGRLSPPRYYLSPPYFQTFRHPWLLSRGYIFRRLDPNLLGLAERASLAASYLHLPSKSHRGIAKKFVQVNSLHQINIKQASEPRKTFLCILATYLLTYREETNFTLHGFNDSEFSQMYLWRVFFFSVFGLILKTDSIWVVWR